MITIYAGSPGKSSLEEDPSMERINLLKKLYTQHVLMLGHVEWRQENVSAYLYTKRFYLGGKWGGVRETVNFT